MFPGRVTKVSVGDLVRVGTTESVSVASWFFELTPGKGTIVPKGISVSNKVVDTVDGDVCNLLLSMYVATVNLENKMLF